MSKFEIDTKLKHISSIIFNIILQNKIITYEEYGDFIKDDSSIEEFEKEQIEKCKSNIDKWINDSEIDKKLEQYISLENDEYGLQIDEINLINDINDSFFELERTMLIDSSEIRDKWKSIVFGKYTEEISRLRLNLEEANKLKANIELKLTQSESEKRNLEDKLILCEQSKEKIKVLSEKYKNEKEELNELLIIKNKEIKTMADENQNMDKEIKNITIKYKELEKRLELIKSGDIKSEATQKEIDHYKKLLNSAKEIKIKSEKEISQYMSMINTINADLSNLNKEISNKDARINKINERLKIKESESANKDIIIRRKDKEINELKEQIQELKRASKKNKMSFDEFKVKSNKIVIETQSIFRSMLLKEKNIDGELIVSICKEPYEILNNLKLCQSVNEGIELIDKVTPLLIDINKKCNKNGLDYDLESEIEKLYDLKEKNI